MELIIDLRNRWILRRIKKCFDINIGDTLYQKSSGNLYLVLDMKTTNDVRLKLLNRNPYGFITEITVPSEDIITSVVYIKYEYNEYIEEFLT